MIRKSKIRSLNPYLRLIPSTDGVFVGAVNPSEAVLKRIGFSDKLENGETVLPRRMGKVSGFNANGKNIVHKDQPMETAYRTVEWHWKEWHGRDTIEQSKFVDVPYKRYPRTFVAPPGLELTLLTDTKGNRIVISPLVQKWQSNRDSLMHAVNLVLELFGECVFFDDKKEQVIDAPMRRLNWKVLPPGERPYAELRKDLKPVLDRVKPGNRSFAEHRLERINGYKPDFTAMGLGGFTGYIVFAFPDKGVYMLESILYGNATYVLGEDWERVSKMTKAEILKNELHKQRIVHLSNWFAKVKSLLSGI